MHFGIFCAFVVVTKQVFEMHNMMTNLLHESGQSGRLVSSGYVEVVRSETVVGEVDLWLDVEEGKGNNG